MHFEMIFFQLSKKKRKKDESKSLNYMELNKKKILQQPILPVLN